MMQDRTGIPTNKAEQATDIKRQPEDEIDVEPGRVYLEASGTASRYRVGDKVYLSVDGQGLTGPYLVAGVPSEGKYTLCYESGETANAGEEVDEKDLTQA